MSAFEVRVIRVRYPSCLVKAAWVGNAAWGVAGGKGPSPSLLLHGCGSEGRIPWRRGVRLLEGGVGGDAVELVHEVLDILGIE